MLLKEYRKSKGMSQLELAKIIGCSVSALCRYENGRIPKEAAMHKIIAGTDSKVLPNGFYGIGAAA